MELCKRVQHRKGKLVSLAAPVFIDGWSTPWYRGLRKLVMELPGFDKNQDGRIEFAEIRGKWRRRLAVALDSDNDGVIDRKEYDAAVDKYAN